MPDADKELMPAPATDAAEEEEGTALGDYLRRAAASPDFRFPDEPFRRCAEVHSWLKALEERCKESAAGGFTRTGPWSTHGDLEFSPQNGLDLTRFNTSVEAWARRSKLRVIIAIDGKDRATVIADWTPPPPPVTSINEEALTKPTPVWQVAALATWVCWASMLATAWLLEVLAP